MSTVSRKMDFVASQAVTNGDEVREFLTAHPYGVRYAEGDTLVLPDIGQVYSVNSVRPFKSGGRVEIYLEFRAECAVEGCEAEFLTVKSVREMRTSPALVRTCPDHRGLWRTPMPHAWLSGYEAEMKARAEDAARVARRARGGGRAVKIGRHERAALDVAEGLSLVRDRVDVQELVARVVEASEAPRGGGRDTRRQVAVRAVQTLRGKGLLRVEDGSVVL